MTAPETMLDGPTDGPLVLAVVGTDHHPFDRLVRWVGSWAESHRQVRVVVQHGTSRKAVAAQSHDYLEHAELQRLMRAADVVVSHGGPSSIAESRRLGTVPIVVPRDPALGEHVDAHQMRFGARLGEAGLVLLADDEQHLHRLLDSALADPSAVTLDGGEQDGARVAACAAFGAAVAGLFGPGAPSRRRLRRTPAAGR